MQSDRWRTLRSHRGERIVHGKGCGRSDATSPRGRRLHARARSRPSRSQGKRTPSCRIPSPVPPLSRLTKKERNKTKMVKTWENKENKSPEKEKKKINPTRMAFSCVWETIPLSSGVGLTLLRTHMLYNRSSVDVTVENVMIRMLCQIWGGGGRKRRATESTVCMYTHIYCNPMCAWLEPPRRLSKFSNTLLDLSTRYLYKLCAGWYYFSDTVLQCVAGRDF